MFECTLLLYTNLRPLTRKGRVVLRIRIDLDDFLAEHWCHDCLSLLTRGRIILQIRIDLDDFLAEHWCRYCLLCILITREVDSHRIQMAVLPPLDEGEQ